jgi:hypothetical protein
VKKGFLIVACLALAGFIGYGVWDVMGGRLPVFYASSASELVRKGEELAGQYRAKGVNEQELKKAAGEVRGRFDQISNGCSTTDRRRPSFTKLGEMVRQIEAAAERPQSQDVLKARMTTVEEVTKELKGIIGTDQDKPLQ